MSGLEVDMNFQHKLDLLNYVMDGWGWNPDRSKGFFSTPGVQTGPETHPASYTVGTRRSIPGIK
jgi:hypothetical protein